MVSGPRRAVFLDPDGVLNRAEVREGNPYSPLGRAEVRTQGFRSGAAIPEIFLREMGGGGRRLTPCSSPDQESPFAPQTEACPPQKLSRWLETREIKTHLKGEHRQ
jgi:hypothetical protein